jgi:hypothetical protein
LDDPPLHPLLCHEVFITSHYTLSNEDLAIIKLKPSVHMDDFGCMANELQKFFKEVHQVRVTEIQPCPSCDVFGSFSSPLE